MVHSGQMQMFLILLISVVSILLLIVNLQILTVHALPVYEVTTRENLVAAKGVNGSGYQDTYHLSDIGNLYSRCPNEVVIFVHGWGINETEAKERLDRVKMSLEKHNYTYPLVGFSWDSDTEWDAAQFLAKWNGPKLADFIVGLKKICEDTKIRLIGHSVGARVILSSIDSLHENALWNNSNFRLTTVHLLGAAVDDEEITTNPRDMLDDRTNWGSPKSDYGKAIQDEVARFYNLYNPKDNVLEQIYPLFEGDFALGRSGHQVLPYEISSPTNYEDVNVTERIKAIYDADGIEAEVFGLCYNNNEYCKIKREGWDFGFCNLLVIPPICQLPQVGDNHAGYIGFRNTTNPYRLVDEGAMDVVVSNWQNNG